MRYNNKRVIYLNSFAYANIYTRRNDAQREGDSNDQAICLHLSSGRSPADGLRRLKT